MEINYISLKKLIRKNQKNRPYKFAATDYTLLLSLVSSWSGWKKSYEINFFLKIKVLYYIIMQFQKKIHGQVELIPQISWILGLLKLVNKWRNGSQKPRITRKSLAPLPLKWTDRFFWPNVCKTRKNQMAVNRKCNDHVGESRFPSECWLRLKNDDTHWLP